ncbi:MAG: response regulator transcription factor [Peptococcales bacterium]|jgi:two-component system response regulator YesN
MKSNKKLKILIVDDEEIIREMLSNIITWNRPLMHVSKTCANGQEAMHYLRSGNRIDIVITDIKMPLMDGITLIKTLKKEFPSVRTLLVTAFAEFSYAQTALDIGTLDFLVKPIRQQELLSVLDQLIEKKQQPVVKTLEEDYSTQLLSLLIKYIKENIITANLLEAAECLGYSANHLSKILHERYGCTFSSLLLNTRMEYADKLINKGIPINQIIMEVGYSSKRRFRQAYNSYIQSTRQGTSS